MAIKRDNGDNAMRYVALLRGINVGGNKKIDMKGIKALLESLGYSGVYTYLNSGNALFDSEDPKGIVKERIETEILSEFGFDVPILIKIKDEMRIISDAIPPEWMNDSTYKTDVAFLFPEIDSEETIDRLPIKKDYLDIRYVQGAIFWNVDRKVYNKSQLNRIASHKYYQLMTVRNVNTARALAK